MSDNYWDTEYAELATTEGGGSGGIIAECLVSSAFKVYASGITPTKAVFPFNAKTKDAQKAKAKKLSSESGDAKIDFGIVIIARKDGAKVKGEDATWKDDRVFFTADFSEANKKIVKPALAKLNIKPGESWLKLGFDDDPYVGKDGKRNMEKDASGNDQIKKVAYPTQLFASKAAAMAGVSKPTNGNGASEPDASIPDGWDSAAWANAQVKILKALVAGTKSAQEIADGYKVDVSFIEALQKA